MTLAEVIARPIKGYIDRSLRALADRIKDLELRPAPRDGLPGAPGVPGRDATAEMIAAAVEKHLVANPIAPGRDGASGQDGKDGATGAKGERGMAGKDGRDGAPGPQGERGVAGKDGRDGSQIEIGASEAANLSAALLGRLRVRELVIDGQPLRVLVPDD